MTEQIREWLQPAIERGGNTHTFEDVWAEIQTGTMQLWHGPKGAAVTQINLFPSGKRQLHVFLAGGELEQLLDFIPSMEAWGAEQGCTSLSLTGRLGWQRVLKDWRASAVIMEKRICPSCSEAPKAPPKSLNG